MAAKPPPELHLLCFGRFWESFTSDRLLYDSVIDIKKRSISVVEFRNTLTALRNAALDSSLHDNNPDFVMEQALEYLSAVEYTRKHADDLKSGWFGKLKVNAKWSSAFAPAGPFGGPIHFSSVKGDFAEEELLILLRWTAAAWHKAQQQMARIAPEHDASAPFGSTPAPVDVALAGECISLLRKAAGAAAYAADVMHARLAAALGDAKRPPVPEYQQWLPQALRHIFIGKAHYIMAYLSFSSEKWALSAKIFMGSSQDFGAAAELISSAAAGGTAVTESFRQYTDLYSVLALARARTASVRTLLESRDAGRASVAAKHAQNELALCAHVAGKGSPTKRREGWMKTFKALEAEAAALWAQCEQDRKYVYNQQLSEDKANAPPAAAQPLAPLEFAIPEKDFELDFEQV